MCHGRKQSLAQIVLVQVYCVAARLRAFGKLHGRCWLKREAGPTVGGNAPPIAQIPLHNLVLKIDHTLFLDEDRIYVMSMFTVEQGRPYSLHTLVEAYVDCMNQQHTASQLAYQRSLLHRIDCGLI